MKENADKNEPAKIADRKDALSGNSLAAFSAFNLTRLQTVGGMDAPANDSIASRRMDIAKDKQAAVGNAKLHFLI